MKEEVATYKGDITTLCIPAYFYMTSNNFTKIMAIRFCMLHAFVHTTQENHKTLDKTPQLATLTIGSHQHNYP